MKYESMGEGAKRLDMQVGLLPDLGDVCKLLRKVTRFLLFKNWDPGKCFT